MRRRLAGAALLAGLAMLTAAAAPAETPPEVSPTTPGLPEVGPPEQIMRLSGAWEIKTEDGKHSCRITLTARRIPAGYVVTQPTPCTDPVLYMDEVVAWRINPETLQLVTVTGAAVSTFYPGDAKLYTRTDPVLLLVSTDERGEGTV